MRAALLATTLIALPVSYEWMIAVAAPFILRILWESVEAIAAGQLLALALVCGVLIPIHSLVEWLAGLRRP